MMMEYFLKFKKQIYAVAGILFTILVGFGIYRVVVFQLISVSPASGSSVADSSQIVELTYNKSLDLVDTSKQIIPSEKIIDKAKVEDNKIILSLENLKIDHDYTITLVNISGGGATINSYVYSFKYVYKAASSLGPKELEAARVKTDANAIKDPVVKNLPISTDMFYITYTVNVQPDSKGKKEHLSIALLLTNDDQADIDKVRIYKNQAISLLKSKGINVADYNVTYAPTVANSL